MKRCPECQRGYGDELFYCLTDGAYLSPAPITDEAATIRLPEAMASTTPQKTLTASQFSKTTQPAQASYHKKVLVIAGLFLAAGVVWAVAVVVNQTASNSSAPGNNLPSNTPTPYVTEQSSTPPPNPTPAAQSPKSQPVYYSRATVLYAGTEGLVVRSKNSVRSTKVTDVFYGDRVKVLLFIDDWAKIETQSGLVGFVRSKYLSIK